ncbi:HutD family protein [Kribbella qitaiheensis]|nr:HutD family protein [Kribbella qitaiheensis]
MTAGSRPHRAVRVLRPELVEAIAWRNGAGTTRELVDDPAGWRLSVAELERNAAFSEFEGLDRVFMPLVDVVLWIDGVRRPVGRCTVASFPGEASVAVELVAGAGRAVNLMTVRGRCSGGLAVVSRVEWERRDHDASGLFVDLGAEVVEVEVRVDTRP